MKVLLIKFLAVVLPFAAFGLVVYATAQDSVPTLPSKATLEVSHVINGQQYNVQLYGTEGGLVAWPTPAFKADPETGNLVVGYEEPRKSDGLAKVSIQLLLYPAPLMRATEDVLTARMGKTGAAPKLVSPLMRELSVTEQHDPLFKPFMIANESNGSEITLVAYMPVVEAKVYVEQLRNGVRNAEFCVRAKLYAKRDTATVTATARVAKVKDTNAYTQLNGTGGTSTTTVQDNSVAQSAAPVTRGQQQDLTAKVADEIVLALQITGQPKQLALISNQVAEFMKTQAFGTERQIDITVTELQKLNPYGFDPNDLKPDVIEKFVADVKNFLSDETKDTFTIAAGGSGYGFSANVSYSKEEVRKKLTDRGWNISQEGKRYIPKSISVSDVNKQNIEAHVGFSATFTESDYGFVLFEQQVTTRARIAVTPGSKEIKQKVVALKKNIQETRLKIADVVADMRKTGEQSGVAYNDIVNSLVPMIIEHAMAKNQPVLDDLLNQTGTGFVATQKRWKGQIDRTVSSTYILDQLNADLANFQAELDRLNK